jgi:type I restriction enzyme S subunit
MSNAQAENVGWVSDSVTQQNQDNPVLEDVSGNDALLPSSWIKTNLGRVLEYGKVEKAEPSEIHNDTWVLELEDIEKDNSKIIQRLTFLDRQSKSTKNRFKTGDVLYGKLRPYLNKIVIADSDGVCTTEIIPLSGNGFLNNRYLFYWLKHPNFLAYVTQVGYGVNMPRLGTKDGIAAPFILAPLAEQQQIAAKLDELLVQVGSIKTRLDAIPKILKRFRQSVLAAAVSGKLTEEWRINSAKLVQNSVSYTDKLGDIEEKEKYISSPSGWTWVRLGSQVKLINGDRGKNYPNSSEYVLEGLPFINTGHIELNGSLSKERMNYISREKFESLGGGKIEPNDLVYCLRGATMGKTAMVHPLKEGAIASSLVIVRPNDSITTKFAYIFLVSPQGKDLILRYDNGSAQPNLSAKSLGLYPLALPSVVEQTEIVLRVEQLFTYADQIEQRVKDAQARVNHLTQSILTKAFCGELTVDWRAQNLDLISGENSAEALLAKIQAARTAKPDKLKRKIKA